MTDLLTNIVVGIYLAWMLFIAMVVCYGFGESFSKTHLGTLGAVFGVILGLVLTYFLHWLIVIFFAVLATMGEHFGQWVLDDIRMFTDAAFGR